MPIRQKRVRVDDDTHRRLRRIAKQERRTLADVLERAVYGYDQERRRRAAELRREPI